MLIFTQTLASLNLIGGVCAGLSVPYAIISGTVPVARRQHIINQFNTGAVDSDNNAIFCLILTSKVGGIGLNIHGASRAIIFEPDWNPGQDEQSAARIHRPEQVENVAVYRLITSNTVEEWIYQRQETFY